MSHIVEIQTLVRDITAVRAACGRLGLPEPTLGTVRLFSGEVQGLAIQLPDWVYPVVADLASGQLKFDDFGGRWGDRAHLDKFLQMYAVEKCRLEAPKTGRSMTEQPLPDGSVKLVIEVAGGAA